MTPLSTDLAKGLPPAGAAGDFIARDKAGNLYLLRWREGDGWQALGWEGAGEAARPNYRRMAGEDLGLITAHRALGKAICRADLDDAILVTLASRHNEMTYVIRNILAAAPPWRGLTVAQIRAACRRMERSGLIEQAQTNYVVQKCWRLTEAGRGRSDEIARRRSAH